MNSKTLVTRPARFTYEVNVAHMKVSALLIILYYFPFYNSCSGPVIISPSLTLTYTIPDRSKIWAERVVWVSLYAFSLHTPHTYVHTDTSMSNYMCCTYKRGGTKKWISGCNSFSVYISLWWHSVWDKGWTRRKNNLSILLLPQHGFFCAMIIIFFFFNIQTFRGIKTSIQVSHLCIVFKIQWGTMSPQKHGHIKRLWNKREEMREIHCIGSMESWWISVY